MYAEVCTNRAIIIANKVSSSSWREQRLRSDFRVPARVAYVEVMAER